MTWVTPSGTYHDRGERVRAVLPSPEYPWKACLPQAPIISEQEHTLDPSHMRRFNKKRY